MHSVGMLYPIIIFVVMRTTNLIQKFCLTWDDVCWVSHFWCSELSDVHLQRSMSILGLPDPCRWKYCCFKMSERTHPVTQYHTPKHLSSRQNSCENLKSEKFSMLLIGSSEHPWNVNHVAIGLVSHYNLNHLVISVEVKPSNYS